MSFGIVRIGRKKCAAALVVVSILFPITFADDAGQTYSESGKDNHVSATIKGTGWKNAVMINMPQSEHFRQSLGEGSRS